MRVRTRSAFSLIELLVVIGIIALLVGLLLPALSQARQLGQQVQCLGHVRGIGTALELFADDHDGEYPVAGSTIDWGDVDPTTNEPSWMEQLDYYVAAEKAAFNGCPPYPAPTPYHYSLSTRAAWAANGEFSPVVRQRIRYSSAFVLVADNNWKKFADTSDPTSLDADKDDYTQPTIWFWEDADHWAPHHLGGLNILFADNHGALVRDFDETAMTFAYDRMTDWFNAVN